MNRFLAGLMAAAGAATPVLGAPAPDVVGKSVIVKWTENRQQRIGGGELRSVNVDFNLNIYLSSAARPFTKLTAAGRRGGGATNEQVGASGASLGGGVRSVRADGRSIVLQATFGNYARNLQIEIAPGGGSCTAQMSVGKQVGSAPTAFRNTSGMVIEIHSMSVSGTTCAIQQGNVFAR